MFAPSSLRLAAKAASISLNHTSHTHIPQSVYSSNQGSQAPDQTLSPAFISPNHTSYTAISHTATSQCIYLPNQGSEPPDQWHQMPSSESLLSLRSRLTVMFVQIFTQFFREELYQFPNDLRPPPVFAFIAYDVRTITDALMGIDAIDGERASYWIDRDEYNELLVRMHLAYCDWFDLSGAYQLAEWELWVLNKVGESFDVPKRMPSPVTHPSNDSQGTRKTSTVKNGRKQSEKKKQIPETPADPAATPTFKRPKPKQHEPWRAMASRAFRADPQEHITPGTSAPVGGVYHSELSVSLFTCELRS